MTSICGSHLNFIMESLQNHSLWSIEFLDLSGKLPNGILKQRMKSFGLYDECLEFEHDSSEVGLIQGQYCTVSYESSLARSAEVNRTRGFDWTDVGFVAHEKDLRLQSGICAPASCSPEEFKPFVNFILSKANLVATQITCSKTQHIRDYLTAWDLLAIPFFIILIMVVAGSTCYDIKQRKSDKNPKNNFLNAFSLYPNTKELLKIDTSPNSIECLNGMRVIAAYWVVCGHRTTLTFPIKMNIIFNIFLNAYYAVDIFFIAGAIVMTKSCLKFYQSGKFNFLKFCFNRYMRYGPGVFVAVLFMLSFIPRALVHGPMSNKLYNELEKCQQHWLQTILMIQTYTNPTDPCVGVYWYLATDFHLYLVSPVIFYTLSKYGFKSFWAFGFVILASAALKEMVLLLQLSSFTSIYVQAQYRIWQWIIGSMIGYMMYHMEINPEKFEISKKIRYSIWIILLSSFICFIQIQSISEFFFNFLIGWAIFTFHHFHSGGIVRWFLSHQLWQPLAKLTLSIYIVHIIYILMVISNVHDLVLFKTDWLLHIMVGDIVICTFMGLVLYLFVEAPVRNVLNILMTKDRKNSYFEVMEEGCAPLIDETYRKQ